MTLSGNCVQELSALKNDSVTLICRYVIGCRCCTRGYTEAAIPRCAAVCITLRASEHLKLRNQCRQHDRSFCVQAFSLHLGQCQKLRRDLCFCTKL